MQSPATSGPLHESARNDRGSPYRLSSGSSRRRLVKAPTVSATGADEQLLLQRVAQATHHAAALLKEPQLEFASLPVVIDRLSARLKQLPDGSDSELVLEQIAARDRLHTRYATRFQALDAARGAVDQLRALTAPPAILARAPGALCAASGFERVLLSLVAEGRMRTDAAYFRDDAAGAEAALRRLHDRPIRLEHPLVETEVLRRRRATIVTDAAVHARVDPGLQEVMGWRSYVAAPLIVGSAPIGLIHADRGPDDDLDVLDRDVLWDFTSALGQTYESAMLRRRLRQQRERLRVFLDWLAARSGELADAPVRLSTFERTPRPPSTELEAAVPGGPRDDRTVFEGLLTRRELEVLRLLVEGRSNRGIADELVIAPGTVRFHVSQILRKLHVGNRSHAVSRYLRLVEPATP
jgi:DNA-binding CsgD family transcriptional regulator